MYDEKREREKGKRKSCKRCVPVFAMKMDGTVLLSLRVELVHQEEEERKRVGKRGEESESGIV